MQGCLTIRKNLQKPAVDASSLALEALGWIVSDARRAERFLALTGLTPDTLRHSAGTLPTQRAVLEFLCAHEPDIMAAADSLGHEPVAFAAALAELEA